MFKSLRRHAIAFPLALVFVAAAAWAQPGGITTGGSTQRPIYVTGKVAMSDGSALREKIEIQLVCPPRHQTEGKTDLKGGFNIQLGLDRYQGSNDASMSSQATAAGFGGQLSAGRTVNQVDGMSIIALVGCFVQAALPGYKSDIYDVSRIRAGDVSTNVGTLFLRPLVDAPAAAVTATSLAIPKEARKSFENARDLIGKRQFADAERELDKAVRLYPKYAEAWQELGVLFQTQNRNAEARKAWLEAISSDAEYPKPYLSLARLSAAEKNWPDTLEKSDALVKLDPSSYPQAYYYAAVAHYNLEHYDKAFDSAIQAVKLDTAHAVPLAEQLLGLLYSMRNDYKSAAEQYRNYLQHVPPATNVEAVKKLLAEAESHAAQK